MGAEGGRSPAATRKSPGPCPSHRGPDLPTVSPAASRKKRFLCSLGMLGGCSAAATLSGWNWRCLPGSPSPVLRGPPDRPQPTLPSPHLPLQLHCPRFGLSALWLMLEAPGGPGPPLSHPRSISHVEGRWEVARQGVWAGAVGRLPWSFQSLATYYSHLWRSPGTRGRSPGHQGQWIPREPGAVGPPGTKGSGSLGTRGRGMKFCMQEVC